MYPTQHQQQQQFSSSNSSGAPHALGLPQIGTPRNQGGQSPLPPCPGVEKGDSYPRRAPSNSSTPRGYGGAGNVSPQGSLPRLPSGSDYASCDEQHPAHHPGLGGGLGSGFSTPRIGSRERDGQNSSSEGRRNKQKSIVMQRTTYSTGANGEKRKDMMTWSYVSSESGDSRPNSKSTNGGRRAQTQEQSSSTKPPLPHDDPFSWFQQPTEQDRPATYSGPGTTTTAGVGGGQQQPSSTATTSFPTPHLSPRAGSKPYVNPELTRGMEVLYNDEEDTDSDFSFCDVVEQEPDRPPVMAMGGDSSAGGSPTMTTMPPPISNGPLGDEIPAGISSSSPNQQHQYSSGSPNQGSGDGVNSGRGISFATKYRGAVKSYSQQNENAFSGTGGGRSSNIKPKVSPAPEGVNPPSRKKKPTVTNPRSIGAKRAKKLATTGNSLNDSSSGGGQRSASQIAKQKRRESSGSQHHISGTLRKQHLFDDEYSDDSSSNSSDDDNTSSNGSDVGYRGAYRSEDEALGV